ncbi:MAG: hypothetical protein JWN51_3514 [Phycisphaerales bacterium]|nr:hypothetical protein [Phycisphaerales bacterium]
MAKLSRREKALVVMLAAALALLFSVIIESLEQRSGRTHGLNTAIVNVPPVKFDVSPQLDWQDAGVVVHANETYRIVVRGAWRIDGEECGAEGIQSRPPCNEFGYDGQLLMTWGDDHRPRLSLHSDQLVTFGGREGAVGKRLKFGPNGNVAGKPLNRGMLHVVILRQN